MLVYNKVLPVILLCLPALVYGDLVDDIVTAIEKAVECAACHTLLVPLAAVASLGDALFTAVFIEVCQLLGVEDADVCQGIVGQQGPVLAQDLRSINAFNDTSAKFCNAMLGLCDSPPVAPYQVSFPKSAPTNPKTWISQGKTPLHVAHISDVHIDREYTAGAEADCNKPICCRNYADHTIVNVPAGATASLKCDSSPALAHAMLRSIPTGTDFSIFTGDVIDASVWLINEQYNINEMQEFNSDLTQYISVPVYPAIGNHEAAPVNLFPRNTTTTNATDAQWVFDTQAAGWARWLDSTATGQVAHYSGSYAQVVPGTSLKIISINTVYWYKYNFWVFDSDQFQPDPNGIIQFTIEQLQAAEDAGQRAWIIAHMAPGSSDALWDQSHYFDQVIQRYKNTIAAQFYGHSHLDQFQIAYSDYSNRNAQNAVSVAMIAPSLTTRDSSNPAFKVYDIDPDTYEIMDAVTYRGDLTDPAFQANPSFTQYYSARETYGPLVGLAANEALTPSFWHKVTEAFEANDAAFQQYLAFLTRGIHIKACDAACKSGTICQLRALRSENNCAVTSPGINFKKRSEASVPATSTPLYVSCEGLHIGHIFERLPAAFARVKNEKSKVNLREVFAKHIKGGN